MDTPTDEAPRASRTAVMVAALRGRAAARGDGLCTDGFAAALAGDEGLAYAAEYERAFPHIEAWIAARTAALDASVRAAIARDVSQIVLLGAGLDTRAARLAQPGVRFFEVDQPASAADKRARLARLRGYPIDAATYVDCDFAREDFLDRLVARGFDATRPAFFVWEGVTYYLPESAVRATLARLAGGCEARSVVAFDIVRRRFAAGEIDDTADLAARDGVARLGEPLFFGTNDPVRLVHDAGFRRVRIESFDALALNLSGVYAPERRFRFQSLVHASVAGPLG